MTSVRAVSITVFGLVQGVSFRAECARTALSHAVTGWVMNREDGSVEVAAEGSADDVESLIDWCQDGSQGARVDDIEVRDVSPAGYTTFDIRR